MNAIDLKGRTAIVTGGARGIGYGVAQRLLASGAAVALWDVDTAALQEAAASLQASGRVRTTQVDVTDETSIAKAVEALIGDWGKIDILINNAGIAGGNGPLWQLEPAVWRRVVEVNLIGPYLVCRAVVPHMVAAGYGRIVNIASIAGKEGNPNASAYAAAKGGVIAMTKAVGKECAKYDIAINCITPATAKTRILDELKPEFIDYMLSRIPRGRFLEVEEVANMVSWLVSKENSFTTASVFDLSGGRATY